MRKYQIALLFGVLVVASYFVFQYIKISRYNKLYESEFRGKIIDKVALRDTDPTHLKIDTKNGIRLDFVSSYLFNFSSKGDSIVKLKGENICLLKRADTVFRMKYQFIDQVVLNHYFFKY